VAKRCEIGPMLLLITILDDLEGRYCNRNCMAVARLP